MRLMVVGALGGRLPLATKLAAQSGADIVYAGSVADAMNLLSTGDRAEVMLIDAALAMGDHLEKVLKAILRPPPVIACGLNANASVARDAIRAGASEYLPLPSSVQDIAALIVALASDDRALLSQVKVASNVH